jgi:broad specificity phosphatase PhoE
MQLWLVRHGESTANAGERTDSPGATPLTEKGHAQAKRFAEGFNVTPKLVVVSPFIRTRQTAAPLLEKFSLTPIERPIQEWIYLDPAKYAGTTWAERQADARHYMETAGPDDRERGAESFSDLLIRVDDFLEEMATHVHSGPIVAFSHGRFIQAVLWSLQNPIVDQDALRSFWTFIKGRDIENLGAVGLALIDGAWQVVSRPV